MTPDQAIADCAREAMELLEEGRPHHPDAPWRMLSVVSDFVEHLGAHMAGELDGQPVTETEDGAHRTPQECARHTARMLAAACAVLYATMPGIAEEASTLTH